MDNSKYIDERCVLCLDPKRCPVSIKCGHSFCFACLDLYKSYKEYPWANKCPICREVLQEPKKLQQQHSIRTVRNNPNRSSSSLASTASQRNSSIVVTPAAPIRIVRSNQDRSSASLATSTLQSNSSLQDFLLLASDYLEDSHEENDSYYDSSGNTDLRQDDDEQFSTPYSHDEEENISYEEGLDLFTDSESYNDNYDNDDYDEIGDDNAADYNYYYDGDSFSYEPTTVAADEYLDDVDYAEDYEHVDNDEENFNYNDETEEMYDDAEQFNIDWETVISSDVIIIE